jgi:hypothetical protein
MLSSLTVFIGFRILPLWEGNWQHHYLKNIVRWLIANRAYSVLISIPILKKWAGYDFDKKSIAEPRQFSLHFKPHPTPAYPAPQSKPLYSAIGAASIPLGPSISRIHTQPSAQDVPRLNP